jgi:periplasmic protein TonB
MRLMRLLPVLIALAACTLGFAQEADPAIEANPEVKPLPLRTPPPTYPEQLLSKKVSGLVALSIVIDDRGIVSKCEVIKSTEPAFEKPALDAVKKWRFKAAEKGGKKVWTRVQLPLQFSPEGI